MCGEHEAREEDHPRFFGRCEAGSDHRDELGRKDFRRENQRDHHEAHYGNHGRKDVPALVFPAFGGIFDEDRNKRQAEGSARHEIIQEVGQGEGGVVGVGDSSGADLARHRPFAEEAEEAAHEHARHDDASRPRYPARDARSAHGRWCITFAKVLPSGANPTL